MSFCKTFLAGLTVTVCHLAVAAPVANLFPHGCEVRGFGFNNAQLIVNDDGQQTFYLIQNRSSQVIELQRVRSEDEFMSPALTAKLDPLNWGAFASDIQNLHFQCLTREGETVAAINCQEVLDVCQYPRVKFALSNMGNYWVATNKAQAEVITDATKKGIYLRW